MARIPKPQGQNLKTERATLRTHGATAKTHDTYPKTYDATPTTDGTFLNPQAQILKLTVPNLAIRVQLPKPRTLILKTGRNS